MVKRIVWLTLLLLVAMLLFVQKLAFLPLILPFYLPTFLFLWLVAKLLKKFGAVPAFGRSLLLLVLGILFFTIFHAWLTQTPLWEDLRGLLLDRKDGGLAVLDPLLVACLLDAWMLYRYPSESLTGRWRRDTGRSHHDRRN